MELWACGFNAWGQLDFDEKHSCDEPQDVHAFRCVLKANQIELTRSSISGTLVNLPPPAANMILAGLPDDVQEFIQGTPSLHPTAVALAGNGKGALYSNGIVVEIANMRNPQNKIKVLQGEKVKQLAANQTSFFALTTEGTVWSWGDQRYWYCLGRETDASRPSSIPTPIDYLCDLPGGPVTKIASGGYLTGALTLENDLYIWGGRTGETPIIPDIAEQLPTPLDIYEHDILDFGIGDRHMIVLTTDRTVFVIGEGANGQLGTQSMKAAEWLEVTLPVPSGQEIVGVAAGPRNSFVLMSDTNT